MGSYPKRLIEVDLPIARISAHARREKSIRHGHISTLHIWWARRPLAACRAVILASLWPDPVDLAEWAREGENVPAPRGSKPDEGVLIRPDRFLTEARQRMARWAQIGLAKASAESASRLVAIQKNPKTLDDPAELRATLLDFIADFANWDNSAVRDYLDTSRALTKAAHEALGGLPGTRPLVVDPFAGGGSIPLEALRVGADAFASDLNPVAVLLNKVVLEYVPKYGQRLADEVRKWGEWIKKEAEKELEEFYPKDPDGATPIAYLWARTIQCEGPGCGYRVPIMGTFYLRKKPGNYVKVNLTPNEHDKAFDVAIVTEKRHETTNDGTARRSSVTCPACQFTTPRARVELQMVRDKGGASHAQLMAVVTTHKNSAGRFYRSPSKQDAEALGKASQRLSELVSSYDSSLSFVPDEELPYLRSIFNVHVYGIRTWGDLFTPRQQLALGTLCRLSRHLCAKLAKDTSSEPELNQAVLICLAFAIDKHADFNSSISRWANHMEKSVATFGRQALGMLWDWGEMVPIGESSGSFPVALDWCISSLNCVLRAQVKPGTVQMVSATKHSLPDDITACLITDPPYYDAVPYADLSDYFYVWLRRSLEGAGLECLQGVLSPKELEVVQLAERNPRYSYKTKERFEQLMRDSLSEGRRYVSPSGLGVVVFAHKSTGGWEAMLEGLIRAGWVVTASWPIDTEKPDRPRAQGSAALASSIHLVCRPRESLDGAVLADSIGDWRDVLQELPSRTHDWMPRLAAEGVVGADAIFACLGPALEIFSRYSRVEKASGEVVTLREYLEHVWAAVAREALGMIFVGADATGFEEDARLTAMWLWTLSAGASDLGNDESAEEQEGEEESEGGGSKAKPSGFVLEYDAARKIAQGLGAHLEDLGSLVEVAGETARLLPVGERTRYLFGKESGPSAEGGRARKKKPRQGSLFEELEASETGAGVAGGDVQGPRARSTVLDMVHQSMILFAAGRGEALKRFLIEDGVGKDGRFWRLADALAALYPRGTDERRWVEGVLARKKGLGF